MGELKTQAKAASDAYLADDDEEADQAPLPADRGQVTGQAMMAVGLVVALTVGAIVAAFLLPIGINEIVGVDTTSWSSGADSLWNIMDVIIVLALFLFFTGVALASAQRV